MSKKKSKTREELQAEIEKAERKKKYYEQQEKILTRKVIPKLTRAERTNRLCTRAGMLGPSGAAVQRSGHGSSEDRVQTKGGKRSPERNAENRYGRNKLK